MQILEIILISIKIVFFILTGAIAFLTFSTASKTVFQPQKIEVLKVQIKLFEELISKYGYKNVSELKKIFDIDSIFYYNLNLLINAFLKNEFNSSKRLVNNSIDPSNFKGKIIKKEFFEKNAIKIESPRVMHDNDENDDDSKWSDEFLYTVAISNKFSDEINVLSSFIKNPLLPKNIIDQLVLIKNSCYENISRINDAFANVLDELRLLYKDESDFQDFDGSWAYNTYNELYNDLNEIFADLVDLIREYLQVDSIFKL